MNIDDLTPNFQMGEIPIEKKLNIIFNRVIKNQAMLETILEMNANIMVRVAPDIDVESIQKEAQEVFEIKLASIQADIASHI